MTKLTDICGYTAAFTTALAELEVIVPYSDELGVWLVIIKKWVGDVE